MEHDVFFLDKDVIHFKVNEDKGKFSSQEVIRMTNCSLKGKIVSHVKVNGYGTYIIKPKKAIIDKGSSCNFTIDYVYKNTTTPFNINTANDGLKIKFEAYVIPEKLSIVDEPKLVLEEIEKEPNGIQCQKKKILIKFTLSPLRQKSNSTSLNTHQTSAIANDKMYKNLLNELKGLNTKYNDLKFKYEELRMKNEALAGIQNSQLNVCREQSNKDKNAHEKTVSALVLIVLCFFSMMAGFFLTS